MNRTLETAMRSKSQLRKMLSFEEGKQSKCLALVGAYVS